MLDPEAFVLKGGTLAILTLAVLRILLHDAYNIWADFQRRRRRH